MQIFKTFVPRVNNFCALLLFGACIASCGGQKAGSETTSAESQQATEASQQVSKPTTEEDAKWREDSLARAQMETPDMVFYNVHGPVHVIRQNGNRTMYFSEDGKLISMTGYDPFDGTAYDNGGYNPQVYLSRDKEERLMAEEGWEWVTEYTWKDGHVVGEDGQAESTFWSYKYTLDEHGNIIRMTGTEGDYADEDNPVKVTYNLTYSKVDAYGNWLHRDMKDADGNTAGELDRTIYYYPIQRHAQAAAGFDPQKGCQLKGTIGGDKNAQMSITSGTGSYQVGNGKRDLRFGFYDAATGHMELYAFKPGEKRRLLGIFFGTVKDGVYKGVFHNQDNFGQVDFNLSIE